MIKVPVRVWAPKWYPYPVPPPLSEATPCSSPRDVSHLRSLHHRPSLEASSGACRPLDRPPAQQTPPTHSPSHHTTEPGPVADAIPTASAEGGYMHVQREAQTKADHHSEAPWCQTAEPPSPKRCMSGTSLDAFLHMDRALSPWSFTPPSVPRSREQHPSGTHGSGDLAGCREPTAAREFLNIRCPVPCTAASISIPAFFSVPVANGWRVPLAFDSLIPHPQWTGEKTSTVKEPLSITSRHANKTCIWPKSPRFDPTRVAPARV